MTLTGAAFVERIEGLMATADAATRPPLALMALATRCRIEGGQANADALRAQPAAVRLHILKLLVASMPPTTALAAVARVSVVGEDGRYLRDEPDLSERMLAVWSGLTPEAAGWAKLTALDRIVCITRLVAAGFPATLDALMQLLSNDSDR